MNSDRMDGEHFGTKSFKPTKFSMCACVYVCVCATKMFSYMTNSPL